MERFVEQIRIRFENCMRFVLEKIFRLKLSESSWNGLMQFIRFGLVGLSNTIIGYLIFAITLKLLRFTGCFKNTDIFISQFVMFVLSVAWSFYWNNKVVFTQEDGEKRNYFAALMKTYATYAFTSLFLSEILLHLWVNILGINEYIAPIINLLITVPLNFVIQKFWAFRRDSNG